MSSPPTSPPIAKAALYYNQKSIWSAVALLAVEEKGYGSDEIDMKEVDINAGESYTATYLRINPKGTVPCLIVPLDKTLGLGVESRYKALTESADIVNFLDKSRSAISKTHTTSGAPAPTLSPATVTLSDLCNRIINLVHSSDIAPIKLFTSARNVNELRQRAGSPGIKNIISRYNALQKQLESADESTSPKYKELWTTRSAFFAPVVELFTNADKEDEELSEEGRRLRAKHLGDSDALWSAEVRKLMATLEKEMIGPLSLGDQASTADLHLAAYLTRLVTVSGGGGTAEGVETIGKYASLGAASGMEWTVGPKVRVFWETMTERRSWKSVYGAGVY